MHILQAIYLIYICKVMHIHVHKQALHFAYFIEVSLMIRELHLNILRTVKMTGQLPSDSSVSLLRAK